MNSQLLISSDWTQISLQLQQLLQNPEIDKASDLEIEEIANLALMVLEKGDFQQKWDIAKLIPKLGKGMVTSLIAILEDESADIDQRWFAGRLLGEFDQPEVIFSLVSILENSQDPELATITANSLANLGQSAINALSSLLSNPESRFLATRALAQIRRREIVDPLLNVVKDEDVRVRTLAIEALSSFQDTRILPILISALEDVATSVRKEAVIALGNRANLSEKQGLLADLQPLLYDLNLEVCQQTAIAISQLPTEEADFSLFKGLKSPHTPIPLQLTLIQALSWRETAVSLDYLEQAISQISPEGVREILRVLGRIEKADLKKPATKILIKFYTAKHPYLELTIIKQELAHSLGQLGGIDAITILQNLAEDPEPGVRVHAIAALKQFEV